ncbi:hypothetical protein J6590_055364 [Homalodisca vitripennis]|nr:hypothetical protein J6590_055364 [Homalodisca vitripennis]
MWRIRGFCSLSSQSGAPAASPRLMVQQYSAYVGAKNAGGRTRVLICDVHMVHAPEPRPRGGVKNATVLHPNISHLVCGGMREGVFSEVGDVDLWSNTEKITVVPHQRRVFKL